MIRNSLDKTLSKFPVDLKNVNFPNIASAGDVAQEYSKFSSSLELPPFPPKKSGNPAVPIGIGGIPPIIIPGAVIANFIVKGASSAIDSMDVSKIIPGGLPAFDNLTADDIKVMGNNTAVSFLNKIRKVDQDLFFFILSKEMITPSRSKLKPENILIVMSNMDFFPCINLK
jgi:hypothetical protein